MWEELLQVDLLWRIQNLGQDVSGEDVRETQRFCGIPPRGIYLPGSSAALQFWNHMTVVWIWFNSVVSAGFSRQLWWNLMTAVFRKSRSTNFILLFSSGGTLTFNRIIWWVLFRLISSSKKSGKTGFVSPNRSWQLIPGAPSPFCPGFYWLCSRLLILPNSPFSG